MKYQFSTTWRVVCLLLGVGVVLAGCSSSGFERKFPAKQAATSAPSTGAVTVTTSPVVVLSPVSNDILEQTFTVSGTVEQGIAALNYRLRDGRGDVILEDIYSHIGGTEFSFDVNYTASRTPGGSLEVYRTSGEGDAVIELNKITIPVRFQSIATAAIKVYFNNKEGDPDLENCSNVVAVDRTVPVVDPLPLTALNELFGGPTEEDINNGFVTQLPIPSAEPVRVLSLGATDGVVTIDFDNSLLQTADTLCAIEGIEAQITETLLQFEEFTDVVITIEGEAYAAAAELDETEELDE